MLLIGWYIPRTTYLDDIQMLFNQDLLSDGSV